MPVRKLLKLAAKESDLAHDVPLGVAPLVSRDEYRKRPLLLVDLHPLLHPSGREHADPFGSAACGSEGDVESRKGSGRMTRTRVLAGSLIATLAIGGCGGGDKVVTQTVTQPAASSTPATSTTAAALSKATARRIARQSVVALSDLPSGWTAADDNSDDSSSSCSGIKEARSGAVARDESPTFAKGSDAQIEDVVYVMPDGGTAQRALAGIANRETRSCIADYAKGRFEKADIDMAGEVETGELRVDQAGSETSAARLTFPIKYQGDSSDVVLDLVIVRSGSVLSFLTFQATYAPIDDEIRDEVARAAARRMATAAEDPSK